MGLMFFGQSTSSPLVSEKGPFWKLLRLSRGESRPSRSSWFELTYAPATSSIAKLSSNISSPSALFTTTPRSGHWPHPRWSSSFDLILSIFFRLCSLPRYVGLLRLWIHAYQPVTRSQRWRPRTRRNFMVLCCHSLLSRRHRRDCLTALAHQ